jgi:hypothetical protein
MSAELLATVSGAEVKVWRPEAQVRRVPGKKCVR